MIETHPQMILIFVSQAKNKIIFCQCPHICKCHVILILSQYHVIPQKSQTVKNRPVPAVKCQILQLLVYAGKWQRSQCQDRYVLNLKIKFSGSFHDRMIVQNVYQT